MPDNDRKRRPSRWQGSYHNGCIYSNCWFCLSIFCNAIQLTNAVDRTLNTNWFLTECLGRPTLAVFAVNCFLEWISNGFVFSAGLLERISNGFVFSVVLLERISNGFVFSVGLLERWADGFLSWRAVFVNSYPTGFLLVSCLTEQWANDSSLLQSGEPIVFSDRELFPWTAVQRFSVSASCLLE